MKNKNTLLQMLIPKRILIVIFIMFLGSFSLQIRAQAPPPQGDKAFTLKLFLEGLYNTETKLMNNAKDFVDPDFNNRFYETIVDQITVELHDVSNYSTIYATFQNVNLNNDGNCVVILPSIGTYWLTIKSRNHLETVSAVPINLATTDSYDFTTAANQAYGSNQKLLEIGVYGIYAGDVNGDGVINVIDRDIISTDFFSSKTGFEKNDLNGDAYVTVADREYANVSFFASIQKNTPQ